LIIDYEEYKDGYWTRVAEEVSVETDFQIEPDTLDRELCSLPQKMITYGRLYSQLKSEVARKEERTKYVYSQLALALRNGEKSTENAIKEKVTCDQSYQEALSDHNHSLKNAILTESWWRSINKKADLVQSLVYRESSEIKRGAY
jgi:hypothetical protein